MNIIEGNKNYTAILDEQCERNCSEVDDQSEVKLSDEFFKCNIQLTPKKAMMKDGATLCDNSAEAGCMTMDDWKPIRD